MIDGVIRTRVGYAGGRQDNPDYGHIGDHTETVQVDYDPQRITYNELLDIFWQSHKPTGRSWSRQYMNAVFYHDDRQRQLAMDSKAAVEKKINQQVKTEVAPLRTFTMAEDYHQKYMIKQHYDLKAEMSRIYPLHRDFVESTAVARLNGYASGYGSKDQLAREIDNMGLTDDGKKALTEMVNRKWKYDRQ
jgi:peptide-methionine (S)-S-oxide reductase